MSAAPSHFHSPPPTAGIWSSLNRFLFTLIILMVAAVIGYRFLPEVSKRREQQARVEQLKAEVEQERQLLARNILQEQLLKRDPEYAGLLARDRLDLMKEGETIYRFDPLPVDRSRMRRNP